MRPIFRMHNSQRVKIINALLYNPPRFKSRLLNVGDVRVGTSTWSNKTLYS